jgi:hypothetical protein
MKIDTAKIDGYAEMSAEDKLKALEAYEFAEPTNDAEKLKAALNKASSEAAEYKRALREKQTEQEREAAERAEREKATMTELETLRKERDIDRLEKQYLSAGYSPELAAVAAKAQADGDTASVLKVQMDYLEAQKKAIEAAALSKQPTLTSGAPPTTQQADREALNKERAWFGLPPIK